MKLDITFFLNSFLLGVGLAMDAFSVSLADGLNEPGMKKRKMCCIAAAFAVFQAAMPMTGWALVHTAVRYFSAFERFVPFIALILLAFIGGKMIYDGVKGTDEAEAALTLSALLMQGVATSIDALSVGFTIAEYDLAGALACNAVIAAVTFVLCIAGIWIGKRFGTKLAGKAAVFGGIILIGIGLEIFLTGILK